jgi:hypothetical protein
VTVSPAPGPVPNNIPTASQWGLLVMGMLVAGAGLLLLRSGSSRV